VVRSAAIAWATRSNGSAAPQSCVTDRIGRGGLVEEEAGLVLRDEGRAHAPDGRPLRGQFAGSETAGNETGTRGGAVDGLGIRSRDVELDQELGHVADATLA
jgi:hypothetical protein